MDPDWWAIHRVDDGARIRRRRERLIVEITETVAIQVSSTTSAASSLG